MLLVLLSLTASCAVVTQPIKAGHKTIVVPDDYGTIQNAVDNATSGDTVFVRSGTYNESVSISKSLSLIGEDKAKTMILGDWRLGGTVVLVCHDGVTLKGFTMKSITYSYRSGRGVHLLHVRRCIVSNCIFLGNGLGVWLYGSSDNIIEDNYIKCGLIVPDSAGIQLQDSSYNCILGNTVADNAWGVMLSTSIRNNLTRNEMTNNWGGISVSFSDNNTIFDNNITSGRYGVIQTSSSYNIIADNTLIDASTGIQISSSSYFNLLEDNAIANSRYCGLELHDSASHNRILGNNITDNKHGLEFKFSSNNTLRNNNITGNNGIGAIFDESSKNVINQNNFINNALHAANYESVNIWDADDKGNYWDNYTGTDADNDYLGDSPYVIDETNRDNYPLIEIAIIPEFQHEDNPEKPTALPSATPTTEPFPTMLVAAIAGASAVIAGVGLLVYFKKRKQ